MSGIPAPDGLMSVLLVLSCLGVLSQVGLPPAPARTPIRVGVMGIPVSDGFISVLLLVLYFFASVHQTGLPPPIVGVLKGFQCLSPYLILS